jgi:ribosomal protein S18 acetylase RimI-like enzyme
MSSPTIHCRPATADDEPFLRRLIIETLTQELAAWLWPEAIREQLLEMQYRGKRQGIAANYAAAELSVIELSVIEASPTDAAPQPVGWIVVAPSDTDLHIVEIAVLPESRGKGIGAAALRGVLEVADRRGVPVRLNVTTGNRAVRLYERLGFRRSGGSEVQDFMLREPGRPPF